MKRRSFLKSLALIGVTAAISTELAFKNIFLEKDFRGVPLKLAFLEEELGKYNMYSLVGYSTKIEKDDFPMMTLLKGLKDEKKKLS